MGNMGIVQALVFEPRKAFAEIAERPRYWFPLLVFVIASTGILVWYASIADLGWATDRDLRHGILAGRLSEEQIAQQVQAAGNFRVVSIVIQGILIPIALFVFLLIAALYNFLVGKMVAFERSFRQWFSFVCWAALPAALAAIPSALMLATTETTQFGREALKTLSLNALIFHRTIDEPGYAFYSSIDLFQLAVLYLSLLGVKIWSGRSWLFSILFVGIPWVLIYGTWAWFSLR